MRYVLAIGFLAACGGRATVVEPVRAPFEHDGDEHAAVEWGVVEAEIAEHICIRRFETPRGPIDEPIFGPRVNCERPFATSSLERAVERAWVDAGPMLNAMRHAWIDSVIAANATPDPAERLVAVRQAYLSERFLGVIVAHLEPSLRDEGLRCVGCPPPFVPTPRTIAWDDLAPYLERYVWADPVETPRDAWGKPTGVPKYGMHICIGINGIGELADPDPALVELGFLATLHNERLRERASALFREIRTEPRFVGLRDDFLRTRWLREEFGPRLLAEPDIRGAVCDTVARFVRDTGITLAACGDSGR